VSHPYILNDKETKIIVKSNLIGAIRMRKNITTKINCHSWNEKTKIPPLKCLGTKLTVKTCFKNLEW